LEELRAWLAAFFGVKLDGENIFRFEDGSELCAVRAEGYGFAVCSCSGEGVGKIKIGLWGNSFEKTRGSCELELVPAHVGEFYVGGEGADGARKNV